MAGPRPFGGNPPICASKDELWRRGEAGKDAGCGIEHRPADHTSFYEVENGRLGRGRRAVNSDHTPVRLQLRAKRIRGRFGSRHQGKSRHRDRLAGQPAANGPMTTSTFVAPTDASASLACRASSAILLQRHNRAGQAGHQGSRIASRTAEVEHPIVTVNSGRLNELGEHHRPQQRAAAPDGDVAIQIGKLHQAGGKNRSRGRACMASSTAVSVTSAVRIWPSTISRRALAASNMR